MVTAIIIMMVAAICGIILTPRGVFSLEKTAQYAVCVALVMGVMVVAIATIVSRCTRKHHETIDHDQAAFAVEGKRLHIVEIRNDHVERTSHTIGRRKIYRQMRKSGLSYDLPYGNRYVIFESVPFDQNLDELLMGRPVEAEGGEMRVLSST